MHVGHSLHVAALLNSAMRLVISGMRAWAGARVPTGGTGATSPLRGGGASGAEGTSGGGRREAGENGGRTGYEEGQTEGGKGIPRRGHDGGALPTGWHYWRSPKEVEGGCHGNQARGQPDRLSIFRLHALKSG